MPSFSVNNPSLQQSGPLVDLFVGPSIPVVELLKATKQPVPAPLKCLALIDTGASSTVLRAGIPASLGLQPRGVANISTPSCKDHKCNTFDVSLFFPQSGVTHQILTVIEAPLEGQGIDCLIGRDLLATAVLVYEGFSGHFSLSF